jgi:hypothetical protein
MADARRRGPTHGILTPAMPRLVFIAVLVAGLAPARARPLPDGYRVVASSISPDGKLGVIAPDRDHAVAPGHDLDRDRNQLVDLATGKVLAAIDAPVAFERQGHTTLAPAWSADGTLLLWYVDGKWGSYALNLLRVDRGAVTAQWNLRELAVRHALAAARRAHPAASAAAQREGKGAGAWFRDGLAIDVRPVLADGQRPRLPLALAIALTSNPKELDSYPADARLAGTLSATVGADGALTFTGLVSK